MRRNWNCVSVIKTITMYNDVNAGVTRQTNSLTFVFNYTFFKFQFPEYLFKFMTLNFPRLYVLFESTISLQLIRYSNKEHRIIWNMRHKKFYIEATESQFRMVNTKVTKILNSNFIRKSISHKPTLISISADTTETRAFFSENPSRL